MLIRLIFTTILVISFFVLEPVNADNGSPYATFFAIHMEVGSREGGYPHYQKKYWPYLINLVKLADSYNAKLTLMFNPQWAEYILDDKQKVKIVKEWQKNGHEIALHYHTVFHDSWNGYTNRKDEKYTKDPIYSGDVEDMMKLLNKLAEPYKIVTACIGKDTDIRGLKKPGFIDKIDFPDEVIYDVDGILAEDAISKPFEFEFNGKKRYEIKHGLLSKRVPGLKRDVLEVFKKIFNQPDSDEIIGIVTHEINFAEYPEYIESWFKFVSEKNYRIRSVRDIMENYTFKSVLR